jgi:exonuclease I
MIHINTARIKFKQLNVDAIQRFPIFHHFLSPIVNFSFSNQHTRWGLLVITAATFVQHSLPAGVLITKTEIDDLGGL